MRVRIPVFCLFLFILGLAQFLPAQEFRKKFIELGWDIPSTQFMRENYREMEENSPFSGLIYAIQLQNGIYADSSQALFTRKPWKRADYQTCIDDLKACKFESFTDNFIRINFSPADVAWDDDEGWEILAEKAAICAWVAKEGGSKGVAPDFESYGAAMFSWNPEKQNGRSFDEAKALARRRGEQFISAIGKEFPDAVVLGLWLHSLNRAAGKNANPDAVLATSHYGLLPSFINGMLAAAPEEMLFVDGCENGYYIEGEQFERYALDMLLWTGPCMNLVEPELRKKYRLQVQCGFGIYLDMYTNPEGSTYYRGPREEKNQSRLDRLCENLSAALNASDQYVWVYGEKNRWWNIPETQNPEKPCLHWEKALPGLSERILMIENPQKGMDKAEVGIRAGKFGKNLLKNPSFDEVKDGKPTDWLFWQNEEFPTGSSSAAEVGERKTVSLQKLKNGCVLQHIEVKDSEVYFVKIRVRTTGNAQAKMDISWQDEKGWDWTHTTSHTANPQEEGEWKTIRTIVVTPPGMKKMVILPGAAKQAQDTDTCHYDDAEVYRLN